MNINIVAAASAKKKKGSKKPRKIISALAAIQGASSSDDDDDGGVGTQKRQRQDYDRSAVNAELVEHQQRATHNFVEGGEDGDIYDYDGSYDEFTAHRDSSGAGRGGHHLLSSGRPEAPRESRYIADLLSNAERRKRENDEAFDRRMAREHAKEEEDNPSMKKEKFVTASYKRTLAEREREREAESRGGAGDSVGVGTGFGAGKMLWNAAMRRRGADTEDTVGCVGATVAEDQGCGGEQKNSRPDIIPTRFSIAQGHDDTNEGVVKGGRQRPQPPVLVPTPLPRVSIADEALQRARKRAMQNEKIAAAKQRYFDRERSRFEEKAAISAAVS